MSRLTKRNCKKTNLKWNEAKLPRFLYIGAVLLWIHLLNVFYSPPKSITLICQTPSPPRCVSSHPFLTPFSDAPNPPWGDGWTSEANTCAQFFTALCMRHRQQRVPYKFCRIPCEREGRGKTGGRRCETLSRKRRKQIWKPNNEGRHYFFFQNLIWCGAAFVDRSRFSCVLNNPSGVSRSNWAGLIVALLPSLLGMRDKLVLICR